MKLTRGGGAVAVALLALLGSGCPGTGAPGSDPRLAIEELVRRSLVLPPSPRTLAALEELRRRGSNGPAACRASSERAHFLIDLFELVRLFPREGDSPSPGHVELWKVLGLPGAPSRGPLATRQVLEGIARALETAAARCGRATELADAEELLAADRRPRRSLEEMRAVVLVYKRIARGGGAYAINAELRLLDWCSRAIRLAAGGDPAAQRARINQCLLTLWEADPRPYFDLRPAARPTDPPWTTVAARLKEKRGQLDARAGRLRALAQALTVADARFFEAAAPVLPTPLDLSRTALPASNAGEPWDRTPVVLLTDRGALVGGQAVLEDADDSLLEQAIAARLHNDRRGRVCLVAAPGSSAARILPVARAARRAGATVLELGVARRIAERAPEGDVQATIFGRDRAVLRLETLPVSLALYSTPNPSGRGRDHPLELAFDRGSAPNELAVMIGRAGIVGASRDGVLPARPAAELAELLATLRRAYPYDVSFTIGIESGLSLGELIRAVELARGLGGVAIAAAGMVPRGDGDLGPLIRVMAALQLGTTPALPDPARSALRRCYLDELRDGAAEAPPTGELELRLDAKGARGVSGALRRRKRLRACAEVAIGKSELATGTRVSIRFSLGPDPAR